MFTWIVRVQEFVSSVATELWVLQKRQVKRWEQGFESYMNLLKKRAAAKWGAT
jgi:hypothetical protein